jgi:glycine oxidase
MATPELTIMGGGILGLSVAFAAARRGARVEVIEAHRIGAGSSGGLVGALAPHVPENWNDKKAFQLDSLLMAGDWWAAVAAVSGLPTGYARLGRLQPLDDARAVAAAQARAVQASTLWQGHAVWQVVPASDFGDWVPPSASGLLVHDTLSARLHPQLACAALAAAIAALGGTITLGQEAPPEGRAPVVWATGHAGLVALSQGLGRAVGGGVKGQALLLAHDAREMPQLFADGLHLVPHVDGTVAIGSTSERTWDAADTTDGQLDAVHARAVAACPLLADAPVLARWAGVRPRAKSRAPMIGAWPGRPGHFIANGGFKIGFGMAPKLAEVMADLVLDGKDAIPEGFRPEASF